MRAWLRGCAARLACPQVIIFSDNIWALREYATRMQRPFIYGPTSHAERTRVLAAFKHSTTVNTVFLSKVCVLLPKVWRPRRRPGTQALRGALSAGPGSKVRVRACMHA